MAVTVVVADDTDDVRMLVRFSLELDGRFDVVGEAADGREAVDLCATTHPDAIILDLQMPVLDGARALPLIRDVSPQTVVVMFTAFSTDEVAASLVAGGAARVVTKTSRPTDLADVVFDCVAERRLSGA
jgi:DNA-binding NarL/FixJ family response regulator